jgi:ABC-type transporter Mla subunit MlaD
MRRLLSLGAILGAVGLAVLLSGQARPDTRYMTYYMVFDNAFGLTEGGDFRLGGVPAGKTTRFTITDDWPARAVVEAQINTPGFEALRRDATCAIRQQSLIGEYYVDCQPGSHPVRLPNAATVPVEQTESTVPIDLVNNVMRRPYRERFRLILAELGTGLAGRPEDIRAVLQRAHPGFRETSKTLKVLGDQSRVIQDMIVDSDTVVEELEAKKTEVSRWIDETGETAAISASRKRQIEADFRSLPPFLDSLESYSRQLGHTADASLPTLADLRRAAPDLEVTFRELPAFARATRIAVRSLGELSEDGRPAMAESREEIDQIRLVARDLPRLATPLRQFLQTADDRGRSTEEDPEAEETAPPEPDKTAYRGSASSGSEGQEPRSQQALEDLIDRAQNLIEDLDGATDLSGDEIAELEDLLGEAPDNVAGAIDDLNELIDSLEDEQDEDAPEGRDKTVRGTSEDSATDLGFTGFESFLNYFYWQAQVINAFDDVSHFLRIHLIIDPDCSPYEGNPSKEKQRKCGQDLGPYQPGIKDPDPTETGEVPSEREDDGGAGTGDDEVRGEGQGHEHEDPGTSSSLRFRPRRGQSAPGALGVPKPPVAPTAPVPPPQLLDYLLAP